VLVVGEAVRDTLVVTENSTVQVEAEATHIPESFEVDIEGAEAGTQFLAGSLTLPSGTTLLTDPETLVVNITAAQDADLGDEPEVEAAEGEVAEGEEGEAAEGGDADAAEGGDEE
jgi:large subunit ribosomal protein L25